MARPRGAIEVTCTNPRCGYFNREMGKNIIRRGKNGAGHQRYFCLWCRTYFVETSGTVLYHRHLSEDEMDQIYGLLVEKRGIRSMERITGHHRDTIGRILEDMAEHAKMVIDHLINDLGFTPVECDELWSTLIKNRKRLSTKARLELRKVMPGPEPA